MKLNHGIYPGKWENVLVGKNSLFFSEIGELIDKIIVDQFIEIGSIDYLDNISFGRDKMFQTLWLSCFDQCVRYLFRQKSGAHK